MSSLLRVAIVGATGAVGQELLTLLEERSFPVQEIRLFASEKSKGKEIQFQGTTIKVDVITSSSFEQIDIAFFSAGATRSKEYIPHALKSGTLVIDNSSAFRMEQDVPLIVPPLNGNLLEQKHRLLPVANCTAIILCMAVAPLQKLGKIKRVITTTYQSASGGGAAMMHELIEQTRQHLDDKSLTSTSSSHPAAFNVYSHNTPILEEGYNQEEWKVIEETRKMLGIPNLAVHATCIRVPVLRAHSESILIEFESNTPSLEDIKKIYISTPGIKIVDNPKNNHFPMPVEASYQNEVLIGRIRKDLSHPNTIALFVSGDQLRRGAALTAIELAELVISNNIRNNSH